VPLTGRKYWDVNLQKFVLPATVPVNSLMEMQLLIEMPVSNEPELIVDAGALEISGVNPTTCVNAKVVPVEPVGPVGPRGCHPVAPVFPVGPELPIGPY
jgi:hypothetical protein